MLYSASLLSPYPPATCKQDGCIVKKKQGCPSSSIEQFTRVIPSVRSTAGVSVDCWWYGIASRPNTKMPATMGQLAKKILKDAVYQARSTNSDVFHFVADTYPPVSIKGAERKKCAASGSQRIKISNQFQSNGKKFWQIASTSNTLPNFWWTMGISQANQNMWK